MTPYRMLSGDRKGHRCTTVRPWSGGAVGGGVTGTVNTSHPVFLTDHPMIDAACPECDRRSKVPEEAIGKRSRCPSCRRLITLQPVEEVEEDLEGVDDN